MYVCGPTVDARAHIGNARPYVLACWYKRWLRERGYEVTLVHNITDVNDKIYAAAPGASAERAAEATEWYLEDAGRFGLEAVDHYPRATESMAEIIRFIVDLIERGFAYEVAGDVYFRVARFAEYGRLSGQRLDELEDEEDNVNPLKEDPRDFALWKANKPEEDTAWDSPWGRGRPGWHIECSAMAEKLLGPPFEIHGGGLDLVFPHHENEVAQSRAPGTSSQRSGCTTACSASPARRCRSRSATSRRSRKCSTSGASRRHCSSSSPRTGAARSTSPTRPWSRPGRSGRRFERLRAGRQTELGPEWDEFVAVLDDDFNTPAALALLHEWRRVRNLDRLRRALELFGLAPPDADAPDEIRELARRGRRHASGATSPSPTGCGRDRGLGLGGARRGRRLPPRPERDREQVYGRRPVHEALRGPREVLELWATERAVASEPWLADGPRVHVKPDREIGEAAETRDHQGVLAWCEPYRYADAHELANVERRCSPASTRSRTRATWAR